MISFHNRTRKEVENCICVFVLLQLPPHRFSHFLSCPLLLSIVTTHNWISPGVLFKVVFTLEVSSCKEDCPQGQDQWPWDNSKGKQICRAQLQVPVIRMLQEQPNLPRGMYTASFLFLLLVTHLPSRSLARINVYLEILGWAIHCDKYKLGVLREF